MVKQRERPMPVEKVKDSGHFPTVLPPPPHEVLNLRLPKGYQLKAGVRQIYIVCHLQF